MLVIALAGCGRIAFDGATQDAAGTEDDAAVCATAVGHDEDADGVDDACDVCPQRGTSQVDTDADGVGDDCDPDDGVVHTRTVFEPFLAPNARWLYDARHQFLGDALRAPLDGAATVLRLPGVTAPSVFEIAGRVGQGGGSVDRLLSISFGPATGPSAYYCELYDGIGGFSLQLTQTPDGVTYTQFASASLPGSIVGGTFRMVLIHTPPNLACTAEWNGEVYNIAGTSPDLGALAPTTYFPVFNLDVEYDYAVRLDLP